MNKYVYLLQVQKERKNIQEPYKTHIHLLNGPLSRTTRVSRYQKGKTNLDFTEARDSEWQWHQLGHMQVCTSLQTDNHDVHSKLTADTLLSFFTGQMPFLPPNQQHQSTEGLNCTREGCKYRYIDVHSKLTADSLI